MSSLVPKLIVTGLGASVSPVAITLLITVMFRDHARRNSLLFLLGYTLTLLAIGVAVVSIFHGAGSGGSSKLNGYIDVAFGVLCLALIPLSVMRKARPPRETDEQELKASRAFYRGIVAMLINSSTMVIYIAGVHEISAARLGTADVILAIVILTMITLVTLVIPIFIYFVFPRMSQRVLGSVRTWLLDHTREIGVVVLLALGLFLLIKGIVAVT
jgi:threonine/homoserine/homoserine lactone efflux protein